MKTLRFEGYSDDTFGEYGLTNEDHDNCASGKPIAYLVTAGGESMLVSGQYAPGEAGGWLIGIAPHNDEDAPIPEWRMWFTRGEASYSPALHIEVPDDAKVRLVTEDPAP